MSAKIIFRTIFYQFFILFIGISIGFILNSEWIGWKSNIIKRSFSNIFFPLEFDEKTCQNIKNWGTMKLWILNGQPKQFEVLEDGLLGEEFYIAKIKFKDEKEKFVEKIESTRIRWKTWEYYYEDPEPWTQKEVEDYQKNGTLNSHESDKAYKLMAEKKYIENKNKNKNDRLE